MLDNYWVKLIGTVVLIVAIYYVVSPYQNCERAFAKRYPNQEGGYLASSCGKYYTW